MTANYPDASIYQNIPLTNELNDHSFKTNSTSFTTAQKDEIAVALLSDGVQRVYEFETAIPQFVDAFDVDTSHRVTAQMHGRVNGFAGNPDWYMEGIVSTLTSTKVNTYDSSKIGIFNDINRPCRWNNGSPDPAFTEARNAYNSQIARTPDGLIITGPWLRTTWAGAVNNFRYKVGKANAWDGFSWYFRENPSRTHGGYKGFDYWVPDGVGLTMDGPGRLHTTALQNLQEAWIGVVKLNTTPTTVTEADIIWGVHVKADTGNPLIKVIRTFVDGELLIEYTLNSTINYLDPKITMQQQFWTPYYVRIGQAVSNNVSLPPGFVADDKGTMYSFITQGWNYRLYKGQQAPTVNFISDRLVPNGGDASYDNYLFAPGKIVNLDFMMRRYKRYACWWYTTNAPASGSTLKAGSQGTYAISSENTLNLAAEPFWTTKIGTTEKL